MPRSKRLYRDLVSLQVPEEQVLNAALREKLAMLPPQPRAPPPKVKEGIQGPGHPSTPWAPFLHLECNLLHLPIGGARAGARHDHAVQPRFSVVRISALDSGWAAPTKASSPAPPFRRYLSHASDAEALGSVAFKTLECLSVFLLLLFFNRIKCFPP